MRRALLVFVIVALIVGGLTAANLRRDGESSRTRLDWTLVPALAREVTTETLARGPIVQTITAPGVVELVDEAKIASQVVGRVVAVPVKDGDLVKKGDLLVQIDDTDAKARRDSALARIRRLEAAIAQSESDRDKARRDLDRSTQLAGRGVVTQTELLDVRSAMDRSLAAFQMSQSELVESQSMLTSAQQDLDYTAIRAPMDGVVAGLDVEVGEVVIAGTTNLPGTVLMTIGDPSRMRVRADVDETDVPAVKVGQPTRIYLQADPTAPVPGVVELVAPKGKKTDEVVSFETLIEVTNSVSTPLRPGMTATIEIEVRRAEDALGVPVQAVVHRRRKDLPDTKAVRDWAMTHAGSPGEKAVEAEARYIKIVFVDENGVARARPVETGLSDEARAEIMGGLDAGDRVIVGPFRALDELKDGDPVVPPSVTKDATADR
jgi:HlyD family secretion protein